MEPTSWPEECGTDVQMDTEWSYSPLPLQNDLVESMILFWVMKKLLIYSMYERSKFVCNFVDAQFIIKKSLTLF